MRRELVNPSDIDYLWGMVRFSKAGRTVSEVYTFSSRYGIYDPQISAVNAELGGAYLLLAEIHLRHALQYR